MALSKLGQEYIEKREAEKAQSLKLLQEAAARKEVVTPGVTTREVVGGTITKGQATYVYQKNTDGTRTLVRLEEPSSRPVIYSKGGEAVVGSQTTTKITEYKPVVVQGPQQRPTTTDEMLVSGQLENPIKPFTPRPLYPYSSATQSKVQSYMDLANKPIQTLQKTVGAGEYSSYLIGQGKATVQIKQLGSMPGFLGSIEQKQMKPGYTGISEQPIISIRSDRLQSKDKFYNTMAHELGHFDFGIGRTGTEQYAQRKETDQTFLVPKEELTGTLIPNTFGIIRVGGIKEVSKEAKTISQPITLGRTTKTDTTPISFSGTDLFGTIQTKGITFKTAVTKTPEEITTKKISVSIPKTSFGPVSKVESREDVTKLRIDFAKSSAFKQGVKENIEKYGYIFDFGGSSAGQKLKQVSPPAYYATEFGIAYIEGKAIGEAFNLGGKYVVKPIVTQISNTKTGSKLLNIKLPGSSAIGGVVEQKGFQKVSDVGISLGFGAVETGKTGSIEKGLETAGQTYFGFKGFESSFNPKVTKKVTSQVSISTLSKEPLIKFGDTEIFQATAIGKGQVLQQGTFMDKITPFKTKETLQVAFGGDTIKTSGQRSILFNPTKTDKGSIFTFDIRGFGNKERFISLAKPSIKNSIIKPQYEKER